MPLQVPGSGGLNKLDYIHKDCKGQQQQNSRFLARHHAKLNSLPDIASPSWWVPATFYSFDRISGLVWAQWEEKLAPKKQPSNFRSPCCLACRLFSLPKSPPCALGDDGPSGEQTGSKCCCLLPIRSSYTADRSQNPAPSPFLQSLVWIRCTPKQQTSFRLTSLLACCWFRYSLRCHSYSPS